MSTRGRARSAGAQLTQRRNGIVLVMTLIVLALMSLAAAALVRAIDTATVVSGSLAFREASIPAANAAIEEAVAALSDARVIADRERDLPTQNYYASRQPGEDARGVPWMLQQPDRYPADARAPDAGDGNALRYVIERVCLRPGSATAANCALVQSTPAPGSAGAGPGGAPPAMPLLRITVRVNGPQNTASLVQAMVRDSVPPRRVSWRIIE